MSQRLKQEKHAIKKALIQAANSLYRSDNALGDCYRRLKSRMGPKSAKCAMARKLAIIYYNMVIKKEEFNIELLKLHQKSFKEKRIKFLRSQLADLEMVA